MTISRSSPITKMYQLHNTILAKVFSFVYLRIVDSRFKIQDFHCINSTTQVAVLSWQKQAISSNLSWSAQILACTKKAIYIIDATLGFIRRNLMRCPQQLSILHLFGEITVMDYSTTVWDPHRRKDVNTLEKTQRRAARWTKHGFRYRSSPSAMLKFLGLESLEDHRRGPSPNDVQDRPLSRWHHPGGVLWQVN